MPRTRSAAIAATLVPAVLTLSGCSDITDEITERAGEEIVEQVSGEAVDIEDGGSQMTVETDEGTMTLDNETGEMLLQDAEGGTVSSVGDELPPDFPTDVPVFPGTVEATAREEADGVVTWIVTGRTDEPLTAITAFGVELEKDRWTITRQDRPTPPDTDASLDASEGDRTITAVVQGSGPARYSLMLTLPAD